MLSGGLRLREEGVEDLLNGLYLIFRFYFHSDISVCIMSTSRGQCHRYFTSHTAPTCPRPMIKLFQLPPPIHKATSSLQTTQSTRSTLS